MNLRPPALYRDSSAALRFQTDVPFSRCHAQAPEAETCKISTITFQITLWCPESQGLRMLRALSRAACQSRPKRHDRTKADVQCLLNGRKGMYALDAASHKFDDVAGEGLWF